MDCHPERYPDPTLGEANREAQIKRVDEHADEQVKDDLFRIGTEIARRRARFTSDPIRHLYVQEGRSWEAIREPRVLGPVMRRLESAGVCAPTEEFKLSIWASNNRRPIRVWRSLIHEDA